MHALKKVDNAARVLMGENIAQFQDLIPEYANQNNTVPSNPKNYNKSNLENKMPRKMLEQTKQKFKIDELAFDPNKPSRPDTAISQITTFDKKVVSKSFVKPTASFLQKYEYQPGSKQIQRAGKHKQVIKTKGGETFIKEHSSLAGTLRTNQG